MVPSVTAEDLRKISQEYIDSVVPSIVDSILKECSTSATEGHDKKDIRLIDYLPSNYSKERQRFIVCKVKEYLTKGGFNVRDNYHYPFIEDLEVCVSWGEYMIEEIENSSSIPWYKKLFTWKNNS